MTGQTYFRATQQIEALNEPREPWWDSILAGLDLETTGVDGRQDAIVQVSFQLHHPKHGTVMRYTSLVNPGVPILNSAMHGVTDEMVKDAPGEPSVVVYLLSLIRWAADAKVPIVAQNARFDFTFTHHRSVAVNAPETIAIPWRSLRVIDPLVMDKAWDKYRKGSRQLNALADHYGVKYDGALHNAEVDTELAMGVARAIGRKHSPDIPSDELHNLQMVWADEQAVSLAEYWRYRGDPRYHDVKTGWPLERGPALQVEKRLRSDAVDPQG